MLIDPGKEKQPLPSPPRFTIEAPVHTHVYLVVSIIRQPRHRACRPRPKDGVHDINKRLGFGLGSTYAKELVDRQAAPFRLETRLLQAEAGHALLYGCMMTWPMSDLLPTASHRGTGGSRVP